MALEPIQKNPKERATAILGGAIAEIIQIFYAPRTRVVNIFTATINQENKYETDQIINYILNKFGEKVPYQLYEISTKTADKRLLKHASHFHLIFVDGFEALRWK